MNAIPLINNIPKSKSSIGGNNETQLRQEINTSLVALKKEAGTLEGLINEAAQMLVTINNRIATLENDTVKKSDVVDVVQSGNLQPVTSNAVADKISSLDVSSVGGSGKYISAISETDGKINATASSLATSVASGNNAPVTSGAVASMFGVEYNDSGPVDISNQVTKNLGAGTILAFRKNNLVSIRIEGTYSGTPTISTQAFISGLPSKYRPSVTQYCCGLAYKNGDSMVYPCRLSVSVYGSIEMSETAFPNGSQLRICIFYMI